MDEKANFTPGPWSVKHGTNVFAVRTDVGHEGLVATTGGHESNQVDCGHESAANARLIAAAPDLLAALEKINLCYDDNPYGCCGNENDGRATLKGSFIRALEDAKAAIAKARSTNDPTP